MSFELNFQLVRRNDSRLLRKDTEHKETAYEQMLGMD